MPQDLSSEPAQPNPGTASIEPSTKLFGNPTFKGPIFGASKTDGTLKRSRSEDEDPSPEERATKTFILQDHALIESLKKEVEEAVEERDAAREALSDQQVQAHVSILALQSRIDGLEKEKKLHSGLTSAHRVLQLEQQLVYRDKSNADCAAQIMTLRNEAKEREKTKSALQSEVKALAAKVEEVQDSEHTLRDSLQKCISSSESSNADLVALRAELAKTRASSERSLLEIVQLQQQRSENTVQIDTLGTHLEEARTSEQNVKDALEQERSRVRNLETELKEARQLGPQVTDLQSHTKAAEAQLESLTQGALEKDEEIKSLRDQLANVCTSESNKKAELETLTQRASKKDEEIESLRDQLANARTSESNKKAELETLTQGASKKDEEIESLQDQLANARTSESNKKAELETLTQRASKKDEEIESLRAQLANARTSESNKKAELDALNSRLRLLDEDRDVLGKKTDQQEKEVGVLRSQLQSAREDHRLKHVEHQEYVKKTDDEMAEMSAGKKELEDQVRELMAIIKRLKGKECETPPDYQKRLKELERGLRDAEQKNQDLKHQLASQVDSPEIEQLALLHTQNGIFVQEIAELRKQVEAHEAQAASMGGTPMDQNLPGLSATQRPPQTPIRSSEILLRLGTGRLGSSTLKDYRHAEAQLIGTLNKPTRNFWKPTSRGQDTPLRRSREISETPVRLFNPSPADEQSEDEEEYTPTRRGHRQSTFGRHEPDNTGRQNGGGKGKKSHNSRNHSHGRPTHSSDDSDSTTDSSMESDNEGEYNGVIDRRQRKTKPKSPYRKRYLDLVRKVIRRATGIAHVVDVVMAPAADELQIDAFIDGVEGATPKLKGLRLDLAGGLNSPWMQYSISILASEAKQIADDKRRTYPEKYSLEKFAKMVSGRLRHIVDFWKSFQPVSKPDGTMETESEALDRAAAKHGQMGNEKRERARRGMKLDRRIANVSAVILIMKQLQKQEDAEKWQEIYEILNCLGVDGMSSEESGVEDGRPVRYVRFFEWRRKEAQAMLALVDSIPSIRPALFKTQGGKPVRKIKAQALSKREAPRTYPVCYYEPNWYKKQTLYAKWKTDAVENGEEWPANLPTLSAS